MFLGTGISLGGFLWLVLPQYQALRRALVDWVIGNGWLWLGEPGPSWLMVVHPEAREVFVWLDFFLISGFMLAVMLAMTAVLAALHALTAWFAGRLGAGGTFRARFVVASYQIAPAAMISLLLGLGTELFGLVPAGIAAPAKFVALVVALVWGIGLGWRIVGDLGLHGARAAVALAPGAIGSIAACVAWWPAVFWT
jgi:hypothetical protein